MTVFPSAAATCGHTGALTACQQCKVRSISICAALNSEELGALSSLARDVSFAPGSALVTQGDPAIALWNVTEGTVRMTRVLPDGRRQIVGFLIAGDFLGLSLSTHYTFSAEAVDAVRACRFDRHRFEALLRNYPHLLRRLLDAASHELALTQDHVVALGRQTADERVAGFLLSLRNRRRALGGTDDLVPLAMTRQDMADHLGLTIETVSRTLSKLARAHIVKADRAEARILDRRQLEALADH